MHSRFSRLEFTSLATPQTPRRRLRAARCLAAAISLLAAGTSCTNSGGTSEAPSSSGPLTETQVRDFTNGGFDNGLLGAGSLSGWTVTPLSNGNYNANTMTGTQIGIATFPPLAYADLGLISTNTNTSAPTNLTSATNGTGVPSGLATADTLRYPYSGVSSAGVNLAGNQHNANVLSQTMTVVDTDMDPADGKVHVRFAVAPVLQNGGHAAKIQPYFFLELNNVTTGKQLFHSFNFSNQPGVVWQAGKSDTTALYTPWQALDIAPGNGAIRIGDQVQARIVAAGCGNTAHYGEIYVDQFGTTFPNPDVNVSAPAYMTAPGTLTYTVTAKNSGNGPATNVVVDFTTPTETDSSSTATTPTTAPTTFSSISATGATCTAPAVGASGQITCNVGTLSPGGSYTFTVTVAVPAPTGTMVAPIVVNEGTYDIKTTQNPTALSGGVVQTQVQSSKPVDLQATLSDNVAALNWGSSTTYTYTVTNNGPNAVTGAAITDLAPTSNFAVSSWTCSGAAGGVCGAVNGNTGPISTTATLPVGASVTYLVHANITGTGAAQNIAYQMTATPPAGFIQSVNFDNVGSDIDVASGSLYSLTLTKIGNGDGTVVSSPAVISCGIGCKAQGPASFASGEAVALWATAAAGETFTGWSGGTCAGTTNPCSFTVGAPVSVTAEFDAPSLATTISATSNSPTSLTTVRPGDTVHYDETVTVPNGQNAGLVLTTTLPSTVAYVSNTTPTITGTVQCNGGVCTAPTTSTSGGVTTFDFGVVTCATAAGCTIHTNVLAQVGKTVNQGDSLVATIAATAATSQTQTVTVVEPNLAIAETASPATGITRGDTTTVTVTVANTGKAGADNVVASFPLPTGTTASNYKAGTCPTATTTFGASSSTFTFPAGDPSGFAAASTCTFTYDLALGATAPIGTKVTIGGGTITSISEPVILTAKSYSYTDTAGTSITTTLLRVGQACTLATQCIVDVCDGSKCGYKDGDGPCTPGADPLCQSDSCSTGKVCKEPAACAADGDCDTTTQFCNTQTSACTPKLTNTTKIPTLTGHSPTLTGVCNTAVGAAVCATGVCDATDNECGLAVGDGTCTATTECRTGTCVTTGGNSGKCEPCVADTACSGLTPACNTTTNQCVTCTGTNTTSCSGTTPVCNTTNNSCAGCTGDNGSGATFACGTAAPYCNTSPGTGGACSSSCFVDSDCGTGNWCDAGSCTAKLTNGTPIPTVSGHAPALAGTCSTAVASAICASGACDSTDNECGLASGDGVCTDSTDCRNGVCVTTGANTGTCQACIDDTTCGGATPVCNTATNGCAACDATTSTACSGVTPVCNTTTFSCTACNGDNGSSATFACPSEAPECNLATGACSNTCTTDNQCASGFWCDASTCVAKLANGTLIPTVSSHAPALTGACTQTIASAICASGICDPKANVCGIAAGDGTCTSDSQCATGSNCSGAGVCVASSTGTGTADGGTGTGTGTGTGSTAGENPGYQVIGGGCSVDGTDNGGAELGALFTLAGLLRARRRRTARNSSTTVTAAKEEV